MSSVVIVFEGMAGALNQARSPAALAAKQGHIAGYVSL